MCFDPSAQSSGCYRRRVSLIVLPALLSHVEPIRADNGHGGVTTRCEGPASRTGTGVSAPGEELSNQCCPASTSGSGVEIGAMSRAAPRQRFCSCQPSLWVLTRSGLPKLLSVPAMMAIRLSSGDYILGGPCFDILNVGISLTDEL